MRAISVISVMGSFLVATGCFAVPGPTQQANAANAISEVPEPTPQFEIDPAVLANLTDGDTFPQPVGKNIYVFLTSLSGQWSDAAFDLANSNAKAFCKSSNRFLVVVIDEPEQVVIDGKLKHVLYFTCKRRD